MIFTGTAVIINFPTVAQIRINPSKWRVFFRPEKMNPLLIKPAVRAVIFAVLFAVAFVSGFVAANWRNGSQIQRLQGQNTVLSGANDQCAANVKNARAAVEAVRREAEERVKQAEEAIREAQPRIETRTAVITKIKELAPVAIDAQCEAIKREQVQYVTWRRNGGS